MGRNIAQRLRMKPERCEKSGKSRLGQERISRKALGNCSLFKDFLGETGLS